MATLPANYLSKKGRQWKGIKLMDAAILLYHVWLGASDQEVGFEDAMETLDSLTKRMNKTIFLDPSILESALWSCNLLNEKGKFQHLKGKPFEEWANELVKPDKFHPIYNTIDKREPK